jgi:hypothetical protein
MLHDYFGKDGLRIRIWGALRAATPGRGADALSNLGADFRLRLTKKF